MYQEMMANITADVQNQHFGEFDVPEEILADVSNFIKRIERSLTEIPYNRLVNQIIRGEGAISHHARDGDLINVIPGHQKVACTRITLAMSAGTSPIRGLGFPSVMRSVREHLIDCEQVTRVVILLTDTWNPRLNKEHIGDVMAHARRGRYVVPHLVSGAKVVNVEWSKVHE